MFSMLSTFDCFHGTCNGWINCQVFSVCTRHIRAQAFEMSFFSFYHAHTHNSSISGYNFMLSLLCKCVCVCVRIPNRFVYLGNFDFDSTLLRQIHRRWLLFYAVPKTRLGNRCSHFEICHFRVFDIHVVTHFLCVLFPSLWWGDDGVADSNILLCRVIVIF